MGTIRQQMQLMLEVVNHLEQNLADKNLQDFRCNPDLAAAVERYLERLSAALGHVPQSIQIKHPNVDWQGIAEIGKLLHYFYDRTLDQQVWQVAKSKIPELKRAVLATISEIDSSKSQ